MTSVKTIDMPGGVKMPIIGLGTFTVTDEKLLETALDTALEAGYRHIDTAHVYANEHIIGKVLKKWFSSGKLKREDVFITTKLPPQGVQPDRVEKCIKESLTKLQLDYVDLYLIHFPISCKPTAPQPLGGPRANLEMEPTDHLAVWKKMEEQVETGRTKTIGLSNFNEKQIERILKNSKIKPACLQVEIHVYLQQPTLVKLCQDNGMVVVAYAPLGNPGRNAFLKKMGIEPGKKLGMLEDTTIKKIADKHKKTPAQVMLKFLLQRNIVVIPKSTTPGRIKENFNLFDFSLDKEDMNVLTRLDEGEKARVCDFRSFKGFEAHEEWPFPK